MRGNIPPKISRAPSGNNAALAKCSPRSFPHKTLRHNEHLCWYCIFKGSSTAETSQGTSRLSLAWCQRQHLLCSATQRSPQQEAPTEAPRGCECVRAEMRLSYPASPQRDHPPTPFFQGENALQTRTARSGNWERMDFNPGTACPGVQTRQRPCQTTPQALKTRLGGHSLSTGISWERTLLPSLIQFMPVCPSSTFAKRSTGDDRQLTGTPAY